MTLSKKGVIPDEALAKIRDLQTLIWSGDAGSGSGMTKFIMLFQPSVLMDNQRATFPNTYLELTQL